MMPLVVRFYPFGASRAHGSDGAVERFPDPPLTTLTLDVDFGGIVPIGATVAGHCGIAPVRGGPIYRLFEIG